MTPWGYVREVAGALGSVFSGMGITLRHLVSRPVTLQYPEERREPPPGFRGRPVLVADGEGKPKCTACRACERICPAAAIQVESTLVEDDGRKRLKLTGYTVDLGRCIVCGLCAEACPSGALVMAPDYELAAGDRESLVYGLDRLLVSEAGEEAREQETSGQEGRRAG
ncbi:MAG TPA: NADH-quinone oxidoreductase subunit I [Firmicutes bacterium]|nr:NADH-quinone oxidoreductase subunit I [Bacillota bacterium]